MKKIAVRKRFCFRAFEFPPGRTPLSNGAERRKGKVIRVFEIESAQNLEQPQRLQPLARFPEGKTSNYPSSRAGSDRLVACLLGGEGGDDP